MPRIRTIKPKYWDDLKIAKVSRDARLIFIAMWNFSDDNGVIIGDNAWLRSKILPYDQIDHIRFSKWIDELLSIRVIVKIKHNGEDFFYIPSFSKHQVINRPNYDEAFIEKSALTSILADIMSNHPPITESSVQEGKGKEEERKRNGKEGKKAKAFIAPTLDQVIKYFNENGYNNELAANFFKYYDTKNEAGENWVDSKGNKVKNWKQKAISVWFKDSHKLTSTKKSSTGNGIAESIDNF